MAKSITVKRKKRGRPATGVDPFVGIRLPQDVIDRLDEMAAKAESNRSQIIRDLLERALKGEH